MFLFLHKQTTDGCDYFTHFADEAACFSWDYCVEFSNMTCIDCISGQSSCSGQVDLCGLPDLCDSVELDFSSQPTEEDCAIKCAGFDGCEWYSYDSSNQFCILTPDCQTALSCPESTCTHGEKSCGGPSFSEYFTRKHCHNF